MGIVYKTKFLQALQSLIEQGEVILAAGKPDKTDVKQLLDILYKKDWIVHAKAPQVGFMRGSLRGPCGYFSYCCASF